MRSLYIIYLFICTYVLADLSVECSDGIYQITTDNFNVTFYGESPSFNLTGLGTLIETNFLYIAEKDSDGNLWNNYNFVDLTFNMSCWTEISNYSSTSSSVNSNETVTLVGMNISAVIPTDCTENCTTIQFVFTSSNFPTTLCFAPSSCFSLDAQAIISWVYIYNFIFYGNFSDGRIDIGSYLYSSANFLDAGASTYPDGRPAGAVLSNAQIFTGEYATLNFENGTTSYDYVDLISHSEGYDPIKGTMEVIFPFYNSSIASVAFASAMQGSLGRTSLFDILMGVVAGVAFCIIMGIVIVVIYKKCPQLRMKSTQETEYENNREREKLIKKKTRI